MNIENSIYFAFAVSDAEVFEAKHFGDADNYLIYHWDGDTMHYVDALSNPFKTYDESQGAHRKGEAISAFLLAHKVQVLVSKRFGKNVQVVHRHFIPVMIDESTKEACFSTLEQYMSTITQALSDAADTYAVFAIREGELKRIAVRQDNTKSI